MDEAERLKRLEAVEVALAAAHKAATTYREATAYKEAAAHQDATVQDDAVRAHKAAARDYLVAVAALKGARAVAKGK